MHDFAVAEFEWYGQSWRVGTNGDLPGRTLTEMVSFSFTIGITSADNSPLKVLTVLRLGVFGDPSRFIHLPVLWGSYFVGDVTARRVSVPKSPNTSLDSPGGPTWRATPTRF